MFSDINNFSQKRITALERKCTCTCPHTPYLKHACGMLHCMVCFPFAHIHSFSNRKDTHKEKARSNKTPSILESMNMEICVAGTSNQLFL